MASSRFLSVEMVMMRISSFLPLWFLRLGFEPAVNLDAHTALFLEFFYY